MMSKFYGLMGVDHPFDPTDRFVTSWIVPSWALLALRSLISLYVFVVLFFILGWNGSHNAELASRRSFSFFTVLTYWGLAFYFLFAALHTLAYVRSGASYLHRWPRPLQGLHSLFYSSIITYPLLVSIVFWVVLYEGPWFATAFGAWSNISQHALNSLFALVEILFPRTAPPPWLHLPALIIILALYLSLAYLTFASQGFYPYTFLDATRNEDAIVAAYVFGILAAVVVIFIVVWLLIWLRQRLTEGTRRGNPANRRRKGPKQSDDVERSTVHR